MKLSASGRTDIGRRRPKNQDRVAVLPEAGLFVVADGMGGHLGGEIASQMAADLIAETFGRHASSGVEPSQALKQALGEASAKIFVRSSDEPELHGMGTTTTAMHVSTQQGKAWIAQVGDSRAYLLRGGHLWQLTRDHSLVQEKLRAGLINREEAKADTMKNVITRSIGFEGRVEIDLFEVALQPNDRFLLCSDGLSGALEDPRIETILKESGADLPGAVEKLIAEANRSGGDDNISAVVVAIS